MKKGKLEIFIPATVSNVACGFDIMGFPMDHPGDKMSFRRISKKGVRIAGITGADDIPLDTEKNVAGIVALRMLDEAGFPFGVEITMHKGIIPGRGIGSSGASAAGAAYGLNRLLGDIWSSNELITFAMEGERFISGSAHADNVAPALLGRFVLIRSYDPLDIVTIYPPAELFVTVIHPMIEVETAYAREIMKKNIPLQDAVTQWGNVAGLVAGLLQQDYSLIGRSLVDVIAEPVRAVLIPGFNDLKKAALTAEALGCSISGSGPSVFALSRGLQTAGKVATAFTEVYQPMDIDFKIYVSGISSLGIREQRTEG